MPRKAPKLMVELGLAEKQTEEQLAKEAQEGQEYRVFLTGKDCAIFVKVLDMAHLLCPPTVKLYCTKLLIAWSSKIWLLLVNEL